MDVLGQPRIHAKSMKLSDGFDLAIKPREAAIVEGLGIQLYKEEAVRFGQHLRSFGARRIQPGFYRIPCDARGKLPTIHLELDSRGNSSVVIDFNEYVINIVRLLVHFNRHKSHLQLQTYKL